LIIQQYFEAAAAETDSSSAGKRAENVMEKPQRSSFGETPTMPCGGPGYRGVGTGIIAGLFIAASALIAFAAKFRILSTVAQISQPKAGRTVKNFATEF
jgi:hypothetical protein